MRNILSISIFLFVLTISNSGLTQPVSNAEIVLLIEKLKQDARGPYKDIRWFCKDGSIRDPKDPCPVELSPGIQHARYKESVVNLGKKNHIYLGQILSYTDKTAFWDAEYEHNRLKQYQLEKYLKLNDDGWVLRKGQYYRGAYQAEDEAAWGLEFFKWLVAQDQVINQNYYLVRSALVDIPHKGDDNVAQLMRSLSKAISDEQSSFMNLRIKIHGQPEEADIDKVRAYKTEKSASLSSNMNVKLDELIAVMEKFFSPTYFETLNKKVKNLGSSDIAVRLAIFSNTNNESTSPKDLITASSEALLLIRKSIIAQKPAKYRLELLEISTILEAMIFRVAQEWQPETLEDLLLKIYTLGKANAGTGAIELWEWDQIQDDLNFSGEAIGMGELIAYLEIARREVEWSTATIKANYQGVVNTYTTFEPKAYGFIDDKIRSSVTLFMGEAVSELGKFIARESNLSNNALDLPDQTSFRGLNPGYAFGELVVVEGATEELEVNSDKIYVFERPPADLKPVAGIATVSEGNLVSHVQLLARNLGIPNATLSDISLKKLMAYNGEKVFYAVSNKGNVIIKLEKDMSLEERELFAKKVRKEEKIAVPIEQIRLDNNSVLNLRSVRAINSGKLCGPKAANLGELKELFPENVVEGIVIPFGIFKDHMDQDMPDQGTSYWGFLEKMFKKADQMIVEKIAESQIEQYQLGQLEILRAAIKEMPLKPEFVNDLTNQFQEIFGKAIGNVPVFLRSDTNMEDLKDFTGAGLNLTLFNVLEKDRILNGIRDVWASPYTERSFKWRQKYLTNPENVFPSILMIPSVDVDYSGVLITKGISNGNPEDFTIAFSRGAGGAVEGQAAESYLMKNSGGELLLAPARETHFTTLPVTGGTGKKTATFETAILNEENLNTIRDLTAKIREILGDEQAFDVELGFKENKLWLFQIRPFVENKKALSSSYLESITPTIDPSKQIQVSKSL